MQEWAQENAPWQDRSGDARALLKAEVVEEVGSIGMIVLQHGVEYGIWLEVANQGKYAIIAPAIDFWGPVFFNDMRRLMQLGHIALD